MAGESLFQNQRAPWLTVDKTASGSVTTPPNTGDERLFVDSADDKLKKKDDAGNVDVIGAAEVTTHESSYDHSLLHVQDHASRHADGGADELSVEDLATAATDTSYALKPDGAGGLAFGAVSTVAVLGDLTDVTVSGSETDGQILTSDGLGGFAFEDAAAVPASVCVIFDTPEVDDEIDIVVPFDCTITGVTLLADQSGSIVVDVWKDTYANFPPTDADSITSATPPTLSAAASSVDTTLSGWTTALTEGDVLRFHVDSVSAVTRVTLSLSVLRG